MVKPVEFSGLFCVLELFTADVQISSNLLELM